MRQRNSMPCTPKSKDGPMHLSSSWPLTHLRRRMGRLDIGMVSREGLAIWGYQEADFWIQYTEETDGSMTVLNIWER